MKAVVFHGPGQATLEEVPKPVPGPDEVVCKVAAVGICYTDIEVYRGTHVYFRMGMNTYPWIAGHEWSGIVESVGADVTGVAPGDRIAAEVTVPCNQCEACRTGKPQLCWPRSELGVTGRYQGAFAEYVRLPACMAVKVPDGVSLLEAAMAEPAAVGLHGIDIMGIDAGDRIVVTGDGPIGVLSARLAQICGAARVVLVGSHDSKLKAAQEAGVMCVVNRHDPDVRDKVLCLLDGAKPDSVIESSGNPAAIDLAASIIRLGGKMLTFGLYQVERVSIDLDYFVVNEIQILTSLAASTTLPRILRLMQAGQLNVLPLHRRYPFAHILEAIEDAANKRTNQVKALIVNEDVVE